MISNQPTNLFLRPSSFPSLSLAEKVYNNGHQTSLQLPATSFRIRGAFIGARRVCKSMEAAPSAAAVSRVLDASRISCLLAQPTKAALFHKILKVHPDFDTMVVKPLLDVAKLDSSSIISLLRVALSSNLVKTSSDPYCMSMRLRMIQPDFVVTQVVNPLTRFGVTNPYRLIRRCAVDLFAAAAMQDGEHTRLLVALSTLTSLLTRKELAAVVKNFPSVLTRSREDLEKTHYYLTAVMGLECSRMATGTVGSSRNAHENRHSTRLRLITSPAWRLSLRRTVARHTLLLFAAQWPPSLPRSVNKSREYIVGQLLKCPPKEFSYWLEYRDDPTNGAGGSTFSPEDVRQFEKICDNLCLEDAAERVAKGADDEEDYPQNESEAEDYP